MSVVAIRAASLEGGEVRQDTGHRLARTMELVRVLLLAEREGPAEGHAGVGAGGRGGAAGGGDLVLRGGRGVRGGDRRGEAVERAGGRAGGDAAAGVVCAAGARAGVDVCAPRVGDRAPEVGAAVPD